MVKAGLFHHNHAQPTLAALSTMSEPPSVSAVTSVHNARPTNAKLLMSLTSAALSTHANHMDATLSSAHSLFQLVLTMKTYTPFNMMNAVAHTPVNATQANASLWDIVHAQKDSFELLLIQTAAAQLSDASHVNTLLLNQQ